MIIYFTKQNTLKFFLLEKTFVISRQLTYFIIIMASRIYPMPPMIVVFSEFK